MCSRNNKEQIDACYFWHNGAVNVCGSLFDMFCLLSEKRLSHIFSESNVCLPCAASPCPADTVTHYHFPLLFLCFLKACSHKELAMHISVIFCGFNLS